MSNHSFIANVNNKVVFAGAGITALSVYDGGGILATFGGIALVALSAASAGAVSRLQTLSNVQLIGAYIFGAGCCQAVLAIAAVPEGLGLLAAAGLLVVGDLVYSVAQRLSERLPVNDTTHGE